jgi:hypothetical protein
MASGRGRLSSIELLGEDYDDIIAWAAGELRERRQLQVDILGEFNRRLAARAEEIGDDQFETVSKSAFGRYSMRQAQLIRRLDQTREISRVLADRLQAGETDNRTIVLAEMIKSAVFEALDDAGESGLAMKDLKAAGDALKAVAAAQKVSSDRRAKLEAAAAEAAARAAASVVEAVTAKAVEAGLSVEAVDQLKRDFLGVRLKPKGDAS